MVEILLNAGINPHCCNGKGQGLLDIAKEKGYTKIANLLVEKEVKNATYKHAFWEGFKSGAIKTAEGTMKLCKESAVGPLAVILVTMAVMLVPGVGMWGGLIMFFGIGLAFFLKDTANKYIGRILSLVTASIGGLINGARIVYNKKIHETQKRQEANTTNPDSWDNTPQEYQPSAPPPHVGMLSDNYAFLIDEEQQPSFITYPNLGCNTRPIEDTTENEFRLSFWSKLPKEYQPSAPPATEEPSTLNNGL